MAHELFGKRFYGHRIPAWHNLGVVSQLEMTAQEALTALGGGYSFDKKPVLVEFNGEMQNVNDSYAIVRSATVDDNTERIFNYVTGRYNIIQPLAVCTMFDEFVVEPVETMGMLGKGEKLFLTWTLPSFDVYGDKINTYGLIAVGYDGKFGVNLNVVTTRVVCQNTWNVAISEAERAGNKDGFGRIWSGKHHSPNIERDFGIWMEHIQDQALADATQAKTMFERMANVPMHTDDFYKVLFGVYPNPKAVPANYPIKLIADKQATHEKQLKYAQNDREMTMALFEGAGTDIDKTAFGGFNAVTEYENWARMTKKSADASILFGNRANTMNRAKAQIMEFVEVR